jgi:hypothetical protein
VRLALVLAAAGLCAAARADPTPFDGEKTGTAPLESALVTPDEPAPAERPSAPTVCDCVTPGTHAGRICWGLVKSVFGESFGREKVEVEGALQGRFFPDALAWALRGVDKHGHFLRVECGPDRKPCPGYRDALERRLMVSAFLSSLPLHGPASDYFDPIAWTIKPPGIAVLKEARRCRPTYWSEIQSVVGVRTEQ